MFRPRPALFLSVLLLATAALAAGGEVLPATHPFMRLLADVRIERGREHRALLVIPISRELGDPAQAERPMTSLEAQKKEDLSAAEPAKNPARGPFELFNWSNEPILLLAGEVFEGGVRDRFLARDVLLGPGSRVVAPGYPADRKPRPKADAPRTLKPLGTVAPDLLRLLGIMQGPLGSVDSFLQDEYALAGEKHPRETLVHLMQSKRITDRMADYRKLFAKIPAEAEGKVIGVAVLVGDRLVGIDLFGSNDLLAAHWPALLNTYAFQASLYEVSYGLLNQAFPAARDPDRYRKQVRDLLKKPFAARFVEQPAVGLGTELRFERERLLGRVLLVGEDDDQALLHAVLSLDLLTSTADAPPPPPVNRGTDPAQGELERRSSRARLTEYERRLLERMRNRRQGNPPGGRQPTPGPGGTEPQGPTR
jgi:hypothetical protein